MLSTRHRTSAPAPSMPLCFPLVASFVFGLLVCANAGEAQPAVAAATNADKNASQVPIAAATVTCSSKPGERSSCAADTSKGVVLLRSAGEAPCLLGKSWGYDQTSVWVSDGCSAEFVTGAAVEPERRKP